MFKLTCTDHKIVKLLDVFVCRVAVIPNCDSSPTGYDPIGSNVHAFSHYSVVVSTVGICVAPFLWTDQPLALLQDSFGAVWIGGQRDLLAMGDRPRTHGNIQSLL